MHSISVTQKTTNRLAFSGAKMWTCKTRARQLVSHFVCVALISVVTPRIDELGKWCQFIRTGVGAPDIFLNWWYVEKSSWRVIMSPNDRVSTTWWRQTRPARTNCYQNKNLGKCVTKNESKFKSYTSHKNHEQILTNVSPKRNKQTNLDASFPFAVPALFPSIQEPLMCGTKLECRKLTPDTCSSWAMFGLDFDTRTPSDWNCSSFQFRNLSGVSLNRTPEHSLRTDGLCCSYSKHQSTRTPCVGLVAEQAPGLPVLELLQFSIGRGCLLRLLLI